ncbi:MAG: GLPGLI family protein [Siphonobacter sp.]
MKRSIVLTTILCYISMLTYGQNPATGKFSYEKEVFQDGKSTHVLIEDLFYNGSESMYVIYGDKHPADTTLSSDENGRVVLEINVNETEDLIYYMNFNTNELLSTELYSNGQRCYVKDIVPKLKWTLVDEKKQIGPYKCQKATTTFRCATYEAWFTTDIPLPIGPWKISGLPGLIVSLINKRVNVTYKLLSARYPLVESNSLISAPVPPKGKYVLFKDFASREKKEQEKMMVFLRAKVNGDQKDIGFIRPECYDEK